MDDIADVKDALIDALRELSDEKRRADIWRRVAYEKIRTRRAVVERVAAGEAVEAVAADYEVPVEWVQAISAPGYDFSSDPEAEIETLKAKIADYEADHRAICGGECAPDELHCSCVPHLRAEITRLAGVSTRSLQGPSVPGLPSDAAAAQTQPTPASPLTPADHAAH